MSNDKTTGRALCFDFCYNITTLPPSTVNKNNNKITIQSNGDDSGGDGGKRSRDNDVYLLANAGAY